MSGLDNIQPAHCRSWSLLNRWLERKGRCQVWRYTAGNMAGQLKHNEAVHS